MPIKAVVLDFDGVIVESNRIKHEAFSKVFEKYPRYFKQIMDYHFAHNAVDRHEKFRHIIKNIMKMDFDEKLALKWARQYADLTTQKIIDAPYVKGALEFIREFSQKLPLFLASATPQDELIKIIKARDLEKYFKKICGAPINKAETFVKIAGQEKIPVKDILFVGDSPEDLTSAVEAGVSFAARKSEHKIGDNSVIVFNEMNEAADFVRKQIGQKEESNV